MIHKAELFRKIGALLQEINDQHAYIASHPESLNALELELFSANTAFLLQNISVLQRLCAEVPEIQSAQQSSTHILPVAAATPAAQPGIAEIVLPELKSDNYEPESISSLVKEVEEADSNRKKETEPTFESREITAPVPATEVIAPSPAAIITPPAIPVAEPVVPVEEAAVDVNKPVGTEEHRESKPRTLNEIISAQKTQEATQAATRFSGSNNKDLKTMVSLNDKLLYIKELFNGYSLAYSEAIEILNRQDSAAAARQFLENNYAQKNNWAAKPATAEHFYELIERRFS